MEGSYPPHASPEAEREPQGKSRVNEINSSKHASTNTLPVTRSAPLVSTILNKAIKPQINQWINPFVRSQSA